jgi:hypothetical protein
LTTQFFDCAEKLSGLHELYAKWASMGREQELLSKVRKKYEGTGLGNEVPEQLVTIESELQAEVAELQARIDIAVIHTIFCWLIDTNFLAEVSNY